MEHEAHLIELAALMALGFFVLYSLASKKLEGSLLTLPILFTAIGFGLSMAFGSEHEPVWARDGARLIAEVTLILVLFSDASHVRFQRLGEGYAAPLRMLAIGMPLSIAFGTLAIWSLSPANGVAVALLTAAILTPTDAALGQTVVSSEKVPLRLRQTINVESGLNDGLALPFVILGAVLTSGAAASLGELAGSALLQIVIGPIVGGAVGFVAARALDIARDREWILESAQGVVFLASAFAAYLAAELAGGNGFIAAFVGGMVFGNATKHETHFVMEFMEGVGQLLTMTAFLVFGAFLLPQGLAHLSVLPLVIAALFLTVVRMAPIWFSLRGSRLAADEKLFLGWFGPRGLASILFTLIVIDEFEIAAENELLACVSMTVAFSILLHGLSAAPLARRFAGRSKAP